VQSEELNTLHFMPNLPNACVVSRESETDTLFEYLVDEATGGWQHWAGCVPLWTYPAAEEKPKFAQLVIPTLDSVR
jgi:dynein heavy chain